MLSGCHSGSALCATCSFCMRLAHSRAGLAIERQVKLRILASTSASAAPSVR